MPTSVHMCLVPGCSPSQNPSFDGDGSADPRSNRIGGQSCPSPATRWDGGVMGVTRGPYMPFSHPELIEAIPTLRTGWCHILTLPEPKSRALPAPCPKKSVNVQRAQPAGQGWTGQNRQDSIGQEGVELDRTGQEGVELWTEQTARQDEAGLKAPPPTPFLPARLSRKALCGALAISNRELSSARSTRFRDKEGRQNMDLQSSMMASSAAPKKQCPRGRLGSRANTPKWGRGSTGSSTRKARGSGEWGRLDPPPPCINHYSEFGKISF
eukprot:gene22468-biopygen2736